MAPKTAIPPPPLQTPVVTDECGNEEFGLELQLRAYVDQYGMRVFSRCQRFTRDTHDAEDAMQQTFIALARQLREMKKNGDSLDRPLAWLLQVAKRCAIDTVRARKRRRTHERAAAGQREEAFGRNPSTSVDARLAVQQTLDTLPAPYRTPLILFYFGGQDLEAIAAQLSMSPNAVSVKLHRGRAMLAKRLRARGVIVPAILLPLLLAEVIRWQVASTAGTGMILGSGGAMTLHASSALMCGSALAASASPAAHMPAISLLNSPLLHSRIGIAVAAVVVATAVSAGGNGMLRSVKAVLSPLDLKIDLLENLRRMFDNLPRFTAINQTAEEADPESPQEKSAWVAVGSNPQFHAVPKRIPLYTAPTNPPSQTVTSKGNGIGIAIAPKAPDRSGFAGNDAAARNNDLFTLASPIESKPNQYIAGANDFSFRAGSSTFAYRDHYEIGSTEASLDDLGALASSETRMSSSLNDAGYADNVVAGIGSFDGSEQSNMLIPIDWPIGNPEVDGTQPTNPLITPEPGALSILLVAAGLATRRRR